MTLRIKSLQLRLTIELAALFLVASCLAMAGLIYSASLTAGSVADRELDLRAEDLAYYVSLDATGHPRLDLPPALRQAYDAAAQQSVFAIHDNDGRLVAASMPELDAIIAGWPQANSEPSYFQLGKFGLSKQDYSCFWRGKGPRIDGAGLGLAIVMEIAKAHGANITVSDRAPHGTRFDLRFQLA